jgi:hypothetical protein
MEVIPGTDDFTNAVVVKDPTWVHTDANHYLDVMYVDDVWPGSVIRGEGMWTVNPIRWFRLPCVDIVSEPVLAYDPAGVFEPDWGHPAEPVVYTVTLLNIGNTDLNVSDIRVEEIDNYSSEIDGWLNVNDNGFSGVIDELVPSNTWDLTMTVNNGGIVDAVHSPAVLTGRLIIDSDAGNGSDTLNITFIVADTVQEPELDTLYTEALSLSVGNAGGAANGARDSLAQMDFHTLGISSIECDTCDAASGHNNAECYLFDASPFVVWYDGEQNRVSSYIHSHTWLSENRGLRDGFRPLEGLPAVAEGTFADYVETGVYCSADSTVGMQSIYVAPQTPDTNTFMVEII